MQLAKDAKHLFRAQTDLAVTAGVPPILGPAQDLHLGGGTDGGQDGLDVGLGVKGINAARRAMHILGTGVSDQNASDQIVLLAGFAAMEGRTDLKQRKIHKATRLIAGRSLQQARQQGRAHMRHLGRDRIGQHGGVIATAKQCS